MASVSICEFSSFLTAQLFRPFSLLLLPNSSHPIFTSAAVLGPLTRSPSRSSKGRPAGPTEGTEVPGPSPPLAGREGESMTPTPLAGARGPHGRPPWGRASARAPSQVGRGAEAVPLGSAGGSTHPRSPRGAAASPRGLPWLRVPRPRGSRAGCSPAAEGLRHRTRIHAPLQGPAPASPLHPRGATHHVTPGAHLAPSHTHSAPPTGRCPGPREGRGLRGLYL